MLRRLVAILVVGGLVLVGAGSALALDYQEPAVPSEFMLAGEAPTVVPAGGTSVFFRLAIEDFEPAATTTGGFEGSGVSWSRAGMPGAGIPIPNDQWTEDAGGAAYVGRVQTALNEKVWLTWPDQSATIPYDTRLVG